MATQSYHRVQNSHTSLLDELFPTAHTVPDQTRRWKRTLSVIVVLLFIVVISALGIFTSLNESTGLGKHKVTYGNDGTVIIGGPEEAEDDEESEVDENAPTTEGEEVSSKLDYSHYITEPATISPTPARLILIGDVHGQAAPLKQLLIDLDYSNTVDTLILVGDLVAKGTLEESLEVLDWAERMKVTAVRGNHDQPVIEWRSWMVKALAILQAKERKLMKGGGPPSMRELRRRGGKGKKILGFDEFDGMSEEKAEKLLPFGEGKWEWEGPHWKIARHMTDEQFAYLSSLPLIIHLPTLHSYVVHAGLLPIDTTSLQSNELPESLSADSPETTTNNLARELSLLSLPPNRVPWNVLNIRSVLPSGEVTKSQNKGTPWADLWNKYMKKKIISTKVNVVYGHAAGRGLDIKDFSFGLDSGCVYGTEKEPTALTALVIGGKDSKQGKTVRFGDRGKGRIVQVVC